MAVVSSTKENLGTATHTVHIETCTDLNKVMQLSINLGLYENLFSHKHSISCGSSSNEKKNAVSFLF